MATPEVKQPSPLGASLGSTGAPVTYREFGDVDSTRQSIFDGVTKALASRYPIENKRYRLELKNVAYHPDSKPFTLDDQKKAIMRDQSLEHKVVGDWHLYDKASGDLVDKKSSVIAHVPYLTHRGTYIYKGNEYTCFHPSVQVWTEQGMIPIGEIVRKKLKVRVWSYDFDQQKFVLRPVVNWFENKATLDLGCSEFFAPGRLASQLPQFNPTTLWGTSTHKVFDQVGNKAELGSVKSLTVVQEKFSHAQTQLMYGSLLGDVCADENGSLRFCHGEDQISYLVFKRDIFSPLVNVDINRYTDQKSGKLNGKFTVNAHAEARAARALCYPGGIKAPSLAWLNQVDELGLAFWFMDDGSSRYQRKTNCANAFFHTQGFSAVGVDLLLQWLKERWGLIGLKNRSEKVYSGRDLGWFISLNTESTWRLFELIAPYVVPCLRYKLLERPHTKKCSECDNPVDCRSPKCNMCLAAEIRASHGSKLRRGIRIRFGNTSNAMTWALFGAKHVEPTFVERWNAMDKRCGTAVEQVRYDTGLTLSLQTIAAAFKTKTGRRFEKTRTVFDIEVAGTHNYFANGILVSNCANQMRLKPGVYTRQRDNGEIEAHVNVKPGTGPSFRIHLEPNTGVYRLGVGQSNLKMYPILKAMGASDADMEKAWGKELLARNVEAEDPRAVSRAFMKLVSTRADAAVGGTDGDAMAKVAEAVDPGWTCTLCGCKLGHIPCDEHEGHHFHRNCLKNSTDEEKAKAVKDIESEKEASLKSKESDRRWSYLWHTGKLSASQHGSEDWILLEVHKGLCEAAFSSLKHEGVECEARFSNPHISVLRPEEVSILKEKFGSKWKGAAKIGQPMRFRLEKIVNLIPHGWRDMDRVWFLECESPDLEKYRTDLGLTKTPRSPKDDDHHMRFHVTFAVKRSETKKVAEWIQTLQRDEAWLDDTFDKEAAEIDHGKMLGDVFNKMELDPDVTQHTLGHPHTNASVPMMLRTSQKLLNIHKGHEETDDRDSLAFQTLHSADDMFAERVHRDAGHVGRKLLWKSTLTGNLKHMPAGALSSQVRSVLLKSGLGMPIEEINPMDVYDQQLRILRLGEGGISSLEAVPDDSRNVQPSHFGFIDPVRGPECLSEDSSVMTSVGWKAWPSVTLEDKLACLVNGKIEFHNPERVIASPYKGLMYGAKTQFLDYLVTPGHRMHVKPQGNKKKGHYPDYRFEFAEEIIKKNRLMLCGGHGVYEPENARTGFVIPSVVADGVERQVKGNPPIGSSLNNRTEPIAIEDWAEFLGWYLSEGCTDKNYVTKISQDEKANPKNCQQIAALLNRMPFKWCFNSGDTFSISSKQLNSYCKRFGFCYDKFIPNEIFEASAATRAIFLDALLKGDGRRDPNGEIDSLTTSSVKLATDTQILAFQLGYSTRISFEPDNREERYLGCYCVNLHKVNERIVAYKSHRHPEGQYYVKDYDGMVYCATVPGGLMYVKRGNSLGFWTGNSSKIGVDSRVAHGSVKGSDGQFYTQMIGRDGKKTHVSAATAARSIIAFPGEFARPSKKIRAMVNSHQIEYVDRDKAHYELPHFSNMFTATSNMVPMINAIKGGRLLMGAKYVVQSLPLKNAEAPLVQGATEDGKSFDEMYGHRVGAVRAQDRGVVHEVTKNGISVMYPGGRKETHQLYDNFPFNRKTLIHNTAVVKPGDQVQPNQLLAKSNYTDGNGHVAIGTNLRTAYFPFKGLNFEDAIVISESAAKKMSSEHMYQKLHEVDENTKVGRSHYVSMYPSRFKPEQLQGIGKDGVVKPGTIVNHGDPLILSLKKAQNDALHRGHAPMWSDNTPVWDHHAPGEITDVEQNKDGGWNVTVKSYMPTQEGDKLAGRYGDKGVVSKIVPDHQMVHDKDGKPMDIILNPLGIISRANPAQVAETLLGKIARKTGKPYVVPGCMTGDVLDFARDELKKHGIEDTEHLTDPETGKRIKDVFTGERFIMKLHHTSESKGSGRDTGAYTSEGLPAKGGALGAKRVSSMEQAALLSHGATEVIRDAKLVRGQRNDDYWRAIRMGLPPPPPKVPFIYDKFLGYMKGAGINVEREGNKLRIMALIDKDIDKMSNGEIQHSKTVTSDKMEEIPGGLFDRRITGGHGGDRWSHISLSEPMPNPVMEEPVRSLLGLTQNKFEDVIAGKEQIGGKTGTAAIHDALKRINLDDSQKHYEDIIRSGPKTKRDKAIKALGYIRGLQKGGLQPADMMLTKVPVVPPNMRPITAYRDMIMPADANKMYQELMTVNDSYKRLKDQGQAELSGGDERLRLYNSFKGVTGLGDPVSEKLQEKQTKGLLAHVFGVGSPKTGLFQRRVLGSSVDMVGRASITPNPDLSMDEVGIPETKAWTIYRPFIMHRLIRSGMGAMEAAKAVVNQTPLAKKELETEMAARPVVINRAPTLHRYGFMAAWPKLVKNETLQLPPVTCGGFNADFDGDAMNYHVPVTDGAVKDAIEKMMPSRNLHSVRDFHVHYTPKNEFLMGLHLATTLDKKNPPHIFKNKAAAIAAYRRGEIEMGDRIEVHQ